MALKSFLGVYALLPILLQFTHAYQGHNEQCWNNATTDEQQWLCNPNQFLVCTVPHPNVYEGTCLCSNTSHYEAYSAICRLNANTRCVTGATAQPCALKSVCTSGTCRCEPGGFGPSSKGNTKICVGGYNTVCSTSPFLEDHCDSTAGLTCSFVDPPDQQRCLCSAGSTYSDVRKKCVSLLDYRCTVDNDCTDNANCVNGLCKCVEGYSTNPSLSNRCHLAYNSTCLGVTTPCNSFEKTECKNGTGQSGRCECQNNTRLSTSIFQRRCLSLVTPSGERCESNADCYSNQCTNSVTTGQKKCVCPLDQTVLDDGTCAVLGVEDGEYNRYNTYCLDNTQCDNSNFLVCNKTATEPTNLGRCHCDPKYKTEVIGLINVRCVVPLEGDCSQNRNCVSRSVCVENKCVCGLGYSKVNEDSTTCHAEVNGLCNRDEDCRRDYGLFCRGGACGCPIGQEWSAAQSHCVALVSGNCTTDPDLCWKNSHCTALGACECDDGFSHTDVVGRKCLRTHGQNCTDMDPCNVYNFLTCSGSSGKCECKYPSQQIYDDGEGKCVSISGGVCGVLPENRIGTLDLNMTCGNHAQCLPDVQGILRCSCIGNPGLEDGQVCPAGATMEKATAGFLILVLSVAFRHFFF